MDHDLHPRSGPLASSGPHGSASNDVGLLLDRLRRVRKCRNGWTALCPAHDDTNPSLSISPKHGGGVLLRCFSGCTYEEVLAAVQLKPRDLAGPGAEMDTLSAPVSVATLQPETGLTLEALAEAKRLPVDLLRKFGCSDTKRGGVSRVRIEYRNVAGDVAGVRFRLALTGSHRFEWRTGSKTSLYPLDRLAEIRERGWALVVEGESDTWTGWHHDVPVIGIPGKAVWRDEWAPFLEGIQLVVWQEPDAGDFTARIAKTRPDLVVIECPPYKDLSEAHLANADVPALVANLREHARSWSEIAAERLDAGRAALRVLAAPVLDHQDPLVRIQEAIRAQGYGGDLTPPLIVYLAATSRLLAMRAGSMPLHLLLVGTSSSGKSYTVGLVLKLMPPEAQHTISAGSPRALIYDDSSLAHVVLLFGEADSLPSDEDNPAASAIRNLLQDHQLHYDVVVRNPETGANETRHIRKVGPTVMLTTSTRKLRDHQMDTRVFSMEVPEHIDKIRAALRVQARLQREPAPEPDPALLAFQSYLQLLAPWDVDVPYLDTLADLIGRSASTSRVLRDFGRITAMIKSIAVLRHTHRERNGQGWVVATLEDYGTALSLVGDIYSASVTGASDGLRRVVKAVDALGSGCNVQQVSKYLGPETNKGSVSRWVRTAIEHGWLVNRELHKPNRYSLEVGDPIPDSTALPSPEAIERAMLQVAQDTDRDDAGRGHDVRLPEIATARDHAGSSVGLLTEEGG